MNHLRVAFALLSAAAAAVAYAAPAATVRLDFAQAVKRTFDTSPTLKASAGRLRAARGAADAAEGARWPRLSASLSASRSNDPLTVFGDKLSQRRATFADFGASQFTGPGSLDVAPQALNEPGPYDNFDTRVQLEWPVYTGGHTSAAIARARSAVQAARNGDASARQAVILDVLRAYEGVRAAAADVAVARRAETAAVSYLATAKKRYAQGTAIRSDVLTAQVSLEQARLERRSARDDLDNAREYLRTLVGLPDGSAIAIGAPAEPAMPSAPLAALQGEAVAGNPELQALRSRAAASRAAVNEQRAAYRPSVSLVARRDWNDRTLGLSAPSYTVAGVVSWDLFDFGARRGAMEQAAGDRDTAEARVAEYRRHLTVRVDRLWRRAREAAHRVHVNATAVEQAREAQRILKLRFGQGLATLTDLLAGQARLDEAAASLVNAHYGLRVSRASLLAALGRLDLDHIAGGTAPDAATAPAPATGDFP